MTSWAITWTSASVSSAGIWKGDIVRCIRETVKPGESVKHGQVIGRSGETGLAGGDHLHFTVLLDGIPVNPTEWWDPHWIHDRIQAKVVQYQQG